MAKQLHIPLQFHIKGNNPTPQLQYAQEFQTLCDTIDWAQRDPDYFVVLVDKVAKLRQRHHAANKTMSLPYGDTFDRMLERLDQKLQALCPWLLYYTKNIEMTETQSVNGYQLYDFPDPFLSWYLFRDIQNTCWNDIPYTKQDFTIKLEAIGSRALYEVDYTGEYYAGFYRDEKLTSDDAWKLTWQDNLQRLYDLPYPKDLVIKSVTMSEDHMTTCVQWSNAFCEWFKRKYIQIHNVR